MGAGGQDGVDALVEFGLAEAPLGEGGVQPDEHVVPVAVRGAQCDGGWGCCSTLIASLLSGSASAACTLPWEEGQYAMYLNSSSLGFRDIRPHPDARSRLRPFRTAVR